MLVNRNLDRSPFTEVSVGSSGSQFNITLARPSFIEIDGRSLLILAGLRETLFLEGDFLVSRFSSEIDYYSQIEGGKYIETETSNTFQNLETGLRMLDFTVADFNNDGTPDIITSFDDSESTDVLGEGIVRYYQLDANGIYQAVPDLFTEVNQESGSKSNTILDVNGDGLLDLVITNSDRETPVIYTNTGDTFTVFTGETNLPAEIDLNETGSIYSVDGDNDGDLDLVLQDDSLSFFRYQDGQYTKVAEADNAFAGAEVSGELAFTDTDGDTDIDVFSLGFSSGEVNYYENVSIESDNPPIAADDVFEVLGSNTQELDILFNDFGSQNQTLTISNFPETTALGSTITREDSQLFYTAPTGITTITEDTFEYTVTDTAGRTNTATVTISIFPQLFFSRKADENPFAYINAGENATPDLADIDGDGDLDLISGNSEAEIKYFRNDDGLLVEQTGEDNPFREIDLGGTIINDSAVAFADYDSDGDLDFVGVSERVRDEGEYFYFQNNDGVYTQLFGETNPVREIGELNFSLKSTAVDWDSDGDEDLVVGSDESILYFQNDDGILQEVAEADNPFQVFNTAAEDSDLDLGSDVSVDFFDFDNDEDLDIITGNSFGNVLAFTNDGDSWTKLTGRNHPFGEDIDLENNAAIGRGDVDNDGDDDVIIGKNNGTFLYWESLAVVEGEPPQTPETPDIVDVFPQSFTLQEPETNPLSDLSAGNDVAPELADIDGDGDLDLISGNSDAEIRYFQNNDGNFIEQTGENNPFGEIDLGGTIINDSAVAFADYDNDGDLDFVGVSERVRDDGEYFYFQNNDGVYTQLFGENNPIKDLGNISATLKPTAVDWDDDGDEDLFAGSNGFVRYFQNDDGILQEVAERDNPLRFFNLAEDNDDAALHLGSGVSVNFFDFDGDEDLDLITGNEFGEILAFQNDGNGWTPLTGENHPFGEDIDVESIAKITKGDLNNDGNEDFIVGSEDSFLSWGNQPVVTNTSINRFQNTDVPGTYLFAGESESENIRENFSNFAEEGLAFKVAVEPGDDLIPLYRFQSNVVPGTYLFAGESERENINENFSEDFTEEGTAFYVYGVGADRGATFYRFQNSDRPGTYLFAGEDERESIIANFPNFIEEGAAFEVGV